MALDSYTSLKASVAGFLNRTDLTAVIPDFITLAENQIRRRFAKAQQDGKPIPRKLMVRADATLDADEEFVTLPERFIGQRTFILEETPTIELEYLSPENFIDLKRSLTFETGADPKYYTVVGTEFQFLPIPAASFSAEVMFLQMPEALSDSVASNWILEDHPDIYLYGALTQSAPYLKNDARLSVWGGLFTQAIADACDADPMPKNQTPRRWSDMPTRLGGYPRVHYP